MAQTAEVLSDVLRDVPDVLATLDAAHEAAQRAVDPLLLELCRLRVATLLGAAADPGPLEEDLVHELPRWPTSPRFGARERACLTFCEQFVLDVSGTTDEQCADVAAFLGPAGLRDLAAALLVVEQRLRLRLVWQALDVPGAR